jgi:hypothetical protein
MLATPPCTLAVRRPELRMSLGRVAQMLVTAAD